MRKRDKVRSTFPSPKKRSTSPSPKSDRPHPQKSDRPFHAKRAIDLSQPKRDLALVVE
ncbi:MAG: hypothetical protein WCD53_30105 [Microcoleus sp.]